MDISSRNIVYIDYMHTHIVHTFVMELFIEPLGSLSCILQSLSIRRKTSLVGNLLVEVVHDELHLLWLRNGHIFELVTQFHDNLGTIGTVGAPMR